MENDSKNLSIAFIAEDDEEVAYLIRFMLEREGFSVIHASDGQKAFEIVQNHPAPAIAVLDIMMPIKDGYQVIAEIRAKPDWQNCPIIMLTAKGQAVDIARALDVGADDYIVKPFQPEEFMARINKLTRKLR